MTLHGSTQKPIALKWVKPPPHTHSACDLGFCCFSVDLVLFFCFLLVFLNFRTLTIAHHRKRYLKTQVKFVLVSTLISASHLNNQDFFKSLLFAFLHKFIIIRAKVLVVLWWQVSFCWHSATGLRWNNLPVGLKKNGVDSADIVSVPRWLRSDRYLCLLSLLTLSISIFLSDGVTSGHCSGHLGVFISCSNPFHNTHQWWLIHWQQPGG